MLDIGQQRLAAIHLGQISRNAAQHAIGFDLLHSVIFGEQRRGGPQRQGGQVAGIRRLAKASWQFILNREGAIT